MAKRNSWTVGLFNDEDGLKAGIKSNIETNEGNVQGSVHYNFSKETLEVQGEFSDDSFGEGKTKLNKKEFDGIYRFPRAVRRAVLESAALIGATSGVVSYLSNTSSDIYSKLGWSISVATIISLSIIYFFGYKIPLLKEIKIKKHF